MTLQVSCWFGCFRGSFGSSKLLKQQEPPVLVDLGHQHPGRFRVESLSLLLCGKVSNQVFKLGIIYRLGYVRIAPGSQSLGMKVSRIVS